MCRNAELRRRVWATWDWSKKDDVLAEEHDLSRQRIVQIRAAVGAPKPDQYRKQRDNATERLLSLYRKDEKALARHVAEAIGVTLKHAQTLMRRNGIPIWDARYKYDWDTVDWRKPNRVIAKEIGCRTSTVASRRCYDNRGPSAEPWAAWNNGNKYRKK